MQRHPFGLAASVHHAEPEQHRHDAPSVGVMAMSDQLGGIRWRTGAAGVPSPCIAARSSCSAAASSGHAGQHASHCHPSGFTTSVNGREGVPHRLHGTMIG
ncbi:hypothetical protein [Acidiphilium acidophilum]|uniref:hypothetical protein n=1 Tax=Acidiphilium acidophilum TaxID=76588 RepID=UPI002E8E75FA|nr:hypothetical protein [Acidiphilium acidophilum]